MLLYLTTNTWKIMIKNKGSSYIQYWDVISLYDWAMSKKAFSKQFWMDQRYFSI